MKSPSMNRLRSLRNQNIHTVRILSVVYFLLNTLSISSRALGALSEDFKPSSPYVLSVNGYEIEENTSKGRETISTTFSDLKSYVLEEFENHPLQKEFIETIDALGKNPYYVMFVTDAKGNFTEVEVVTANERFKLPRKKEQPTPPKKEMDPEQKKPPEETALKPVVTVAKLIRVNGDESSDTNGVEKDDIISTTFERLNEHHDENPEKDAQLSQIKAKVVELGLQEKAFSIRWSEWDGKTIKPVTIVYEGGAVDLDIGITLANTPPESEEQPMAQETDNQDQDAEQESRISLPQLIDTWEQLGEDTRRIEAYGVLARLRPEEVSCQVVDGNQLKFTYPRLRILTERMSWSAESFTAENVPEALRLEVAKSLNSEQRKNVMVAALYTPGCLQPYFKLIRLALIEGLPRKLVKDFSGELVRIHQRQDQLEFDSSTHSHVYHDDSLRLDIEYALDILTNVDDTHFSAAFPKDQVKWATTDTTTEQQSSKNEPIDILANALRREPYLQLETSTELGQIGRGTLLRLAVQHRIAPEQFKSRFMLTKVIAENGNANSEFLVICAGGALEESGSILGLRVGSNLVQWASLSPDSILDIKSKKTVVSLRCDTEDASLTSPTESLSVNLPKPSPDFRYTFGEDKTLKAVMTFPMASSVGKEFAVMITAGTAAQGFSLAENSKVTGLDTNFIRDMQDADFFIPADHGSGGNGKSQLLLGNVDDSNRANRLVLRKKIRSDQQLDIVLYIPPFDNEITRSVHITDDQLASVFKARRSKVPVRRLTVLNVACNSQWTVDMWTRAYKKSLIGQAFNSQEIESLKLEVPIVVGATRSFQTDSTDYISSHAKYPLGSLEIASNEGAFSAIRGFLQANSFGPVCNIDRDEHFTVEGQRNTNVIEIQTRSGERIVE